MFIRDILSLKGKTLFSIDPAGRVSEAVRLMVAHDVGSLVVMEDGRMAGMLTFREVLKALDARGGDLGALQVGAVMDTDPVCGSPDDTIDHLREVMTQNHIRYLPVREGDALVGVISFHDVARAVIKETSLENRLLKRYIKHWPEEESAG
jgi:CBS domain-containing protein